MSISFGLGYTFYSRTRLRWLGDYLVYLGCYGAWLLFSTYFYFQAIYLTYPLVELSLVAVVLRVLVTLIILYAGPLFALRIAELPVGRREWWLLAIPVGFVFGTVLVFYSTGSERVAIVPNGVFNFYLGALFLAASLRTTSRVRRNRQANSLRRAFLPFLWFSVGIYAVLFAANVASASVPGLFSTTVLDVGFAAAYCFLWSVITIVTFLARQGIIGPPPAEFLTGAAIPPDFVKAFDMTDPESEIAQDLMTGVQNNEIADRHYLSPHTVETHIYNIYQKCAVKNRIEFIRLVERYRL